MPRRARGLLPVLLLLGAAALPAAESAPARGPVLERGVLLVARRELADPNFSRSVILVTQVNDAGSAGLVLNRPLELSAAAVLPPLADLAADAGRLYLGGPVEPETLQLLVGADLAPADVLRIVDGVYLAPGVDALQQLDAGRAPGTALRLYAGYAGWAAGQLQQELRRGDWHLWQADAATVFTMNPDRLWNELEALAGGSWVRAGRRPGADVAGATQYNYCLSQRGERFVTGKRGPARALRQSATDGSNSMHRPAWNPGRDGISTC